MNQRIANLFGALGYVSILCQWLWMTVVLLGPLLRYETARELLLPAQSTPTDSVSTNASIPEPVAILFMILAVVFAIGLSLYALYALPKSIGTVGRKATNSGADVILPHVIHRSKIRKVTKKRKKVLRERLTWSIKLGMIAVPLIALMVPVSPALGLEQDAVIGFGVFCAAASLIWFSLQFTLAKAARIPAETLW